MNRDTMTPEQLREEAEYRQETRNIIALRIRDLRRRFTDAPRALLYKFIKEAYSKTHTKPPMKPTRAELAQ